MRIKLLVNRPWLYNIIAKPNAEFLHHSKEPYMSISNKLINTIDFVYMLDQRDVFPLSKVDLKLRYSFQKCFKHFIELSVLVACQ